MSEYYGVTRSGSSLKHYGVRGMKWGVRKYTDSMGRPNQKWNKLYGRNSGKVRPRKLQRDFNNLDKSYATIHALKLGKGLDLNTNFLMQHALKERLKSKEGSKRYPKALQKYNKNKAKLTKDFKDIYSAGRRYATQERNIESMQDDVAAKAVQSGYSVKSKAVKRLRTVPLYANTSEALSIRVKGSKIKVRKNGNGRAEFTMYKKDSRDGIPQKVDLRNAVYRKKSYNRKRR